MKTEKKGHVVLLIGLQGAGKTTFFRHNFADTHQHISKDNFRNAANRDKRQLHLLSVALKQQKSVVIDNTNPSPQSRADVIELARRQGAHVIGYYFQSQVQACLERNAGREGKARVPDVAIFATSANMVLPRYEEGFDQLFYVRQGQEGSFEVLEWRVEDE